MVDSDSQKDQGGNPLGEGTIVGQDGEDPRGKRDNYMHSKVASPYDEIAQRRQDLPAHQQHAINDMLIHEGPNAVLRYLNNMGVHFAPADTANTSWEMLQAQSSNREPYAPLWDKSYVEASLKEAGFLAEAIPAAAGALGLGGAEDAAAGGLGGLIGKAAPYIMGKALGTEAWDATKGLAHDIFGGGSHTSIPGSGLDSAPNLPELTGATKRANDPTIDPTTGYPRPPTGYENPSSPYYDPNAAGHLGMPGSVNTEKAAVPPQVAPALATLPLLAVPGVGEAAEGAELGDAAATAETADAAVGGKAAEEAVPHDTPTEAPAEKPSALKQIGQGAAKQLGWEALKSLSEGLAGGGASGAYGFDPAPTLPQLTGSTQDALLVLADTWDGKRGEVGDIDTDENPEKDDQKEFNDGDKSPKNPKNPNTQDSGKSGEDETHQGIGAFNPDSPSVERMMMVLPLVMHYVMSEESGLNDPILRALHEQMDSENPGYLEHGKDDPHGEQVLQVLVEHQKGSHPRASEPHPQEQPSHTANTQGPQTPEQIAAVQQLLLEKSKHNPELLNMIPDVPVHPEEYAKFLHEIQGQPNTAPLVDPSQASPPPMPAMGMPGMQGAPGAMPVVDPTQPQGGGGMPMQPMASKISDANNHVPRCPKCGSGSTRVDLMSQDNPDEVLAYCPSCHNTWHPKTAVYKVALDDLDTTGLIWQDVNGQPIEERRSYKLTTPGFDVPERVTVLYKKPNELGLKLTGVMHSISGDNEPDIRLKSDQMQARKYAFVPDDEASTEGAGGIPGDTPDALTTDQASDTFPNRGTALSSFDPLAWLEPENFEQRTAGKHFTLKEQRELINEKGSARNLDLLDLSNTHYLAHEEDDPFLLGFGFDF
jgi:hypothetical protein